MPQSCADADLLQLQALKHVHQFRELRLKLTAQNRLGVRQQAKVEATPAQRLQDVSGFRRHVEHHMDACHRTGGQAHCSLA